MFFRFSARCSRDTVEMQGFELAAISVPPSDFQNFFEVATGHRKNAGNRAGGHFLSSLFSLLSFLCSVIAPFLCARLAEQDPCILAGDYEASRPPTLQKCSDSRRPRGQQTLLSVNLGMSGGLFCDLFSLLSSLFSRFCSTRESANPVAVQLLLRPFAAPTKPAVNQFGDLWRPFL